MEVRVRKVISLSNRMILDSESFYVSYKYFEYLRNFIIFHEKPIDKK